MEKILLPLVGDKKPLINLRSDHSVSADYTGFSQITQSDVQRVLLQLPLPTKQHLVYGENTSSSNVSTSLSTKVTKGYYSINGKQYAIKQQYFHSLCHFSINIAKENAISENAFRETYLEPFLNYYEGNYNNWLQEAIGTQQQAFRRRDEYINEKALDSLLSRCLYDVISSPLLHSLSGYQRHIQNGLDDFVKIKGMKIIPDPTDAITTNRLPLDAVIQPGASLAFMGLHSIPDLAVGYSSSFENCNHPPLVSVTALGELKLPSLQLAAGVNILCQKTQHELSGPAFDEMQELKAKAAGANNRKEIFKMTSDGSTGYLSTNLSKVTEMQDIIRKLVTQGCHAGVTKLIITTYNDFLLIKINPEFVKIGFSPEKANKGFKQKKAALLIDGSHYSVSSHDKHCRLKIAAFLNLSRKSVDELKLFQEKVGMHLGDVYFERFRSPPSSAETGSSGRSRPSTGASSKPSSCSTFDDGSTGDAHFFPNKKRYVHYQGNSSSQGTGNTKGSVNFRAAKATNETQLTKKLTLVEDLLHADVELNLVPMIKRTLQAGKYLSQVFVVNKQQFCSKIPIENIFCDPLEDESEMIVKIFDPLWAAKVDAPEKELSEEELTLALQESADRCVNELKAYIELSPLVDVIIPKLYGYITLFETFITVGKPFIRWLGPSLFLDSLELQKNAHFKKEDVDREFLIQKIIPAFNKIHSRGVIHGDVEFRNLLITKELEVMILDFSHSKINATEVEIAEEVQNIYLCFGFEP